MNTFTIVCLFFGVLFAVVPTLAKIYGLDMTVENPNCPEDVNGVRKNKIALKVMYGISAVSFILAIIFHFLL